MPFVLLIFCVQADIFDVVAVLRIG